jgi:hypothetical protein
MIFDKISCGLLLVFALCSCSTEVDIWDDWRNVPIVYSVISPKDSVHVIRINKAFGGNLPVEDMAICSDSLIYDYDINVQMSVFDHRNRLLQICQFQKEYILKDSVNGEGEVVFSIQKHHVYVYRGTIPDEGTNTYKIEFTLADGHNVQATTTSLYGFVGMAPPSPIIMDYNSNAYKNLHFNYTLPQDAGCIKVVVTCFYYEVLLNGNIQKKEVEFTSGLLKAQTSKENPTENRQHSLSVKGILSRFRNEIDSAQTMVVSRYLGKLNVVYLAGNESFAEYMFFRLNSLNMELERPNTIKGGYGLFGTRRYSRVSGIRMDARTYNLFYDNLRNHKFRSANAYPVFLGNLPDSLQ